MAYSLGSVFKGSALYAAGQLLTGALGFLLLPLYTRFLTPADYGIIGYLTVVVELLATVLLCGFPGAQGRFYYECNQDRARFGEFAFSTNAFLVGVSLLVCTCLTLAGPSLHRLLALKDLPYYPFFPIVIWTAFFQVLSRTATRYFLSARHYAKGALLQIAQFAIPSAFSIVFVVALGEGALGKMKGGLIGSALLCVAAYPYYAKRFVFRFRSADVKYALLFGIPLVFHVAATVVHNSIDRVVLERYVSFAEIGIYTVGYTVGSALGLVSVAVNQAWSPNLTELMEEMPPNTASEIRRAFGIWLFGMSSLCTATILWAEEVISQLAPESYNAAAELVPLIVLGILFNGFYMFFATPIFFYKKTKYLPLITGTSAAINIGLNIALIPSYGVRGAAIATMISFAFQAGITYLVASRFFDPHFEWSRIAAIVAALFAVLLLTRVLDTTLWSQLVKGSLLIAQLALSYVLFARHLRPVIREAWSKLRRSRPRKPPDSVD